MSTKQTSARYNEGKIQSREIDPDFILGIGEVLTKSRAKYEHFNWQKPTNFSTPYESLMRHLMAFQKGEEIDQETGCHHLLHAATNIMFLHYHAINNSGIDDRGFKKVLTKNESYDTIVKGDYARILDLKYPEHVGEIVKVDFVNYIDNVALVIKIPSEKKEWIDLEKLKRYNN